jgi:hypothetical protein
MRDEWFDFLPIFILFFFICYPYEFVQISETSLGKLFAIFLIVYYSSVDLVYGILVCAIVVFYYHVEVATSIWSIERSRQMQESMMGMMREMDEPTGGSKRSESKCGCSGSKCGGCSSCSDKDVAFESFCPANPDLYLYDSFDPSRGKNYNETVLNGVSPKKELEQLMKMKSDMLPSIDHTKTTSQYASVSDTNMIAKQPEGRNIINRIFEPVRP